MNIYVGNLPKTAKDRELEKLFEPYGKVVSAAVIRDRKSGEPRGFGFVEMATRAEGEHAIAALNETEFGGQKLHVNEAREREGKGGPGPGSAPLHGRGGERWDHHGRGNIRGGWEHGSRGGHTNRGPGGKRGT
jgi:RNA recognition motif-containing protein